MGGANWFIKADDDGWVAATALQVEAIDKFFHPDKSAIIHVSDGGFYKFRNSGSGQSDRRYTIQDRTFPKFYREIAYLRPEGHVGQL